MTIEQRLRSLAERAAAHHEDWLVAAYDHKGRPRPPAEETDWASNVLASGLEETDAAYIAALEYVTVQRICDVLEAVREWAAPVDHAAIQAADPDHFCDDYECDGTASQRAVVAAALRASLQRLDAMEGAKP